MYRSLWAGLAALLLLAGSVLAAENDERGRFLSEVFPDGVPKPRVIWFTGELKRQTSDLLGHRPRSLRQRYWLAGRRSAWVIDEVGKERPITFGVVVDDGRISELRVIRFRESRGGEIRFPFYTSQFKAAGLDGQQHLDRRIDGISGATLSVRASKKAARLALLLHDAVIAKQAPGEPR